MQMRFQASKSKTSDEIWYLTFERLDDFGGGLATYVRSVIAAAREEGRPVRIFQRKCGAHAITRTIEGGVTIVDVPDLMTPRLAPLGYWMMLSWRFAEAVCAEINEFGRPRGVEAPDGFALGYFLFQKKLVGEPTLKDLPLTLVAHTPVAIIDEWIGQNLHVLPNWWTYRAEKWCFRAADAVIILSSMLENELRERGYLPDDVKTWRSANPYIPASAPDKAAAGASGAVVRIGMASRMINWKGLREALLVAKASAAAGLPARFEFCGGVTDDFHRAQEEFAQLFSSNIVTYLGVLDRAKLDARRATWSCQLHPSPKDNLPYAVVEALAQGVPCLIAPGNGVAEALPDDLRKALVVDYRRPDKVLAAIARADDARKMLAHFDFQVFGAKAYFDNRDRVLAEIAGDRTSRARFPFLDDASAKGGLRPKSPIPSSPTKARLTVVVPYYNMGDYIGACVQSIRDSAIMADIVIVNDGSTAAASIKALDAYRGQRGLRIFDIPNGGVARARNFGVDQVTTEYVALLDADDTVEPSYYAKALNVLDTYDNVGFVGCWANDFRDGTGETIRYWPTYNAEPLPNIVINNTNCQALIYRADLFRTSGQHDPALKMYLDDWDAMLGMLDGGYFGVMLPEPLFNYRQRANSIFSSGRSAWDVNYAYIARKHEALFKRNGVEALLFSNANGPNRDFHLLGGSTPINNRPGADLSPGRLKMPHRFARSLAKRLMVFSSKGYRN